LKDSDQLGFTRQEPIDKVVEKLASDILEATAISTPQVSTSCLPVPPIPSYFQAKNTPEKQAEDAVEIHYGSRSESSG
jgi:hypothetical protein